MTWVEYFLEAAEKSRSDERLWVRYLNKAIQRDKVFLEKGDVVRLLNSPRLTLFQKNFLAAATEKGSEAWEMTVSLSEPARFQHLQNVLKVLE